jgi:hypothetical protein
MELSDIFKKRFLDAASLQGREHRVTIEGAKTETLNDELKLIVWFVGKDKEWIVNKTNSQTIAQVHGTNTDRWAGGEVVLFSTTVQGPNGMVQGIRCRAIPREPATGDPRPRSPLSDDLNDAIGF